MLYSLMTVLHELVFNFENICDLYNIVEIYLLDKILGIYWPSHSFFSDLGTK